MSDPSATLALWHTRWQLTEDGPARTTATSLVQPVLHKGKPAFLKIATHPEEERGNTAMAWWSAAGNAVAPVLAHDGAGLLMARAPDRPSLADHACANDAGALGILCGVIACLHRQQDAAPNGMLPVQDCFGDLFTAARNDERLGPAASAADRLMADADDEILLHGDLHHDNVLDFGTGGWRAIDPKGLTGPRALDYARLFCNPDHATATDPAIFAARLLTVAQLAELSVDDLALSILAWSGLSAAWVIADGQPPDTPLAVAAMARAAV